LTEGRSRLQFDDNALVPVLFGEHDQNLARLEEQLGVSLASFGNEVRVTGPDAACDAAGQALEALYERLKRGLIVGDAEVDAAARLAKAEADGRTGGELAALHGDELRLKTRKRHVTPRSPRQAAFIRALLHSELSFGIGPAGTGKTYLAVATAVTLLLERKIDRLILSRPAVEAGERLGFLPGDMKDKVDPYLRPLYDALHDMLPGEQVARYIANGDIEIAPLAFMRGRTLANSFIILDEAQNTTPVQMKMFITRLGENSRMAVTGDLSQVDLPSGAPSGLRDAADLLKGIDRITFVQFTDADVGRHSLVTRIVQAYEAREKTDVREVDLFDAK